MNRFRSVRFVGWALVAMAAYAAMDLSVRRWVLDRPAEAPTKTIAIPSLGGSFTLTDHYGRRVSEKDFAGRPLVVFFGFTFCPDICPTTLTELTALMADAGPAADRIQVLFVTVDHERDTPPVLKSYMAAFDSRFLGLTGSAEDIAAIAKAYRVYYKKVQRSDGYTMDHTALVFLMDSQHRFAGTIDPHQEDRRKVALAKLRRLLAS